MPSTPTPRLRVMQQGLGENINAWGDPNLNNALQRLEEGQAKVLTLPITGDVTLTVQNYVEDQARSAVLVLTGTPSAAFKVTIPSAEKPYLVDNRTGQVCTIGTAAGVAASVRAGIQNTVFCNGTDTRVIDLTLDQIRKAIAPIDLNGQTLTNAAQGTAPTDVPTFQQLVDVGKPNADAAAAFASNASTSAATAVSARDDAVAARNTAVASASLATSEANRAQGYANSINLPAISAADAGKTLIIKPDGSGYDLTAPGTKIGREARTSNVQLMAADVGKFIDIVSGTFTQTFVAAATLGSGWFTYLRNSGSGDITLDPNGSETIDGLASFIMYPGEVRLIQCDGTALRSIVLAPFSKAFTQSDTFVKPPGYSQFGGMIRSGGASGSRSNTSENGPGGAGGGAFPFQVPADKIAASSPVVVGSGGNPVTTNATDGNLGGDSSFAGIIVGQASAQQGGAINKVNSPSNTTKVGDFGPSSPSFGNSTSIYGGGSPIVSQATPGGTSVYGGAAGGSLQSANTINPPGTSTMAGNGGAASLNSAGSAGLIPSGGGGASRNGFASGAGARGQVDIWGVA